jgi:hypothetical protein
MNHAQVYFQKYHSQPLLQMIHRLKDRYNLMHPQLYSKNSQLFNGIKNELDDV